MFVLDIISSSNIIFTDGEAENLFQSKRKLNYPVPMFKIEKRPTGYILTFSGVIDSLEMQKWKQESIKTLSTETRPEFGVIIDMKDLQPLTGESKDIMISGQQLYKAKGMKRSAVILNNPRVTAQFKNLAIASGIYSSERYIDASEKFNAGDIAVEWVKDGIDPDK